MIGIDAATPPNPEGSSHGETRITRLAVGEGSAYVPLVRRSHELWRELEEETTESLMVQCEGLILGGPHSTGQHGVANFVAATIEVARAHAIEHEVLSAAEIRARFAVFAVSDEVGYFERTAGYLRAPSCIHAELGLARRAGAALRLNQRVLSWTSTRQGVTAVQRQAQFWFDIRRDAPGFEELPVFIWMHGAEDGQYFYGFHAVDGRDGGVKVAAECFGATTSPEHVARAVDADESADMHASHVAGRLPGLLTRCLRSTVCLYTVTPDFGFIIDRHPGHRNVVVASPCSGHGFKHSAAVGECVARLAIDEQPLIDLSAFGFARFDSPPDRMGQRPSIEGAGNNAAINEPRGASRARDRTRYSATRSQSARGVLRCNRVLTKRAECLSQQIRSMGPRDHHHMTEGQSNANRP